MPKSNEPPRPVTLANWGGFKVSMLTNPAYQRVSQLSANRLAVNRIETFFSIQGEEWPVVVQLWAQMISGVPSEHQPIAQEVTGWNQIVNNNNMPIVFDENGFLNTTQTDG